MKILYTLLRLTGSLIFLLLFYAVTLWVSENTSNDFSPLLVPLTAFGAYVGTFIWINLIMLNDSLDGKLLHTAQGKRELLWQLADNKAVTRQGWPWWYKPVVVWLGYRGAVVYALALAWLGVRQDQPFAFLLITRSVAKLRNPVLNGQL